MENHTPMYSLADGEKYLTMLRTWSSLTATLDAALAAERKACQVRNAVQVEMANHHAAIEAHEDAMGVAHSVQWIESLYGRKRVTPNKP